MRPSNEISVLPVALRQQLLAMPLTADECREAGQALSQAIILKETGAFCRNVTKNTPRPDRWRGV